MFSLSRRHFSRTSTSLFQKQTLFFIPHRNITLESHLQKGINAYNMREFAKATNYFNDVIRATTMVDHATSFAEKKSIALALTYRARMSRVGTEADEDRADQDLEAALKLCPGLEEALNLQTYFSKPPSRR